MEAEEQDKSEQATPFKLMRAREKGTVSRGADLGFLTGLSAFFVYMWVAGPELSLAIQQASREVLTAGPHLAEGDGSLLAATAMLFMAVMKPLAFMALVMFLVVLLFELIQTGVVFSGQPLKPDFNRLNPVQGLKRLFSIRMLIEAAKNVFKLVVYSAVGWLVISAAVTEDLRHVTDARSLLDLIWRVAFTLISVYLLVAFGFAVLDQIITRRDYSKRMRMSRRDVRREHREREGEPRMKQKRKQLHAEFVKLSQSLHGLKGADVLIINPTHIALALRYDPRKMAAPVVVSLGTDRQAARLRRLAFLHGIPIVENKRLAQELLRLSGLNRPVPEQCYQAVAEIYNNLRKQNVLKE